MTGAVGIVLLIVLVLAVGFFRDARPTNQRQPLAF